MISTEKIAMRPAASSEAALTAGNSHERYNPMSGIRLTRTLPLGARRLDAKTSRYTMLGTPAIADTIHTDSPPETNMAFTPQKIPMNMGTAPCPQRSTQGHTRQARPESHRSYVSVTSSLPSSRAPDTVKPIRCVQARYIPGPTHADRVRQAVTIDHWHQNNCTRQTACARRGHWHRANQDYINGCSTALML